MADRPLWDSGTIHPLARALDPAPAPFALTGGPTHALVFANRALRRLFAAERVAGVPIGDVLLPESTARLASLLDRAFHERLAVQEQFLGRLEGAAGPWSCSIWPLPRSGSDPEGLMIELRMATHAERNAALQHEIAERLLVSALRESEAADAAQASRRRTEFLLDASRRLGQSIDEDETRDTLAELALPALGSWCIVDVIETDGTLTRLAMIHPDPGKREQVRALAKDWVPRPGDAFGAPVVMRNAQPVVTTVESPDLGEALAASVHNPENLRLLGELGVGPLLTVPLVSHGKLLGAVTFVSGQRDRTYTKEDIELAEGLAARGAEALHGARLYGEALQLREQADAASRTRMRFLGNVGHEIRTPLTAIAGYAQLIEMGIHGPVTDAQRQALERIRLNQEHLLVLITDILNFVRAGLTPIVAAEAVPVADAVRRALDLLEGLAARRPVRCRNHVTDPGVVADADPDRVQQILLNLISNAVKFSHAEGVITIRSAADQETVRVSVADTGVGIAPDKIESIFEPFVQVDPKGGTEGGVGLGLAISRDLARAMRGDLTVESKPGVGSCFTLTLPRHWG